MESLYAKLYEKYTKLKAKKFEELERPNKEQEITFMSYVTAAEELIEHLRNEKDRLSVQVNELRNEVSSLRSKEYDQCMEYQDLLMEDNQKIKELKEENARLLKLQQEGLFSNTKESEILKLQASIDNPTVSETTPTRSESDYRHKSQNISNSGLVAEGMWHPVPASIEQSRKESASNEALASTRLPECCWGINTNSGYFLSSKVLIESLVGMKLSASSRLHGICISALHESSGYAFSLTWVQKVGNKEAELLYEVISLGTLARIAPEWMRDEIMFSINMCPLFFERISRFIRLNK